MKFKKIKANSILVKTNLPVGDFVINPYVGCQHSCVYCYARFMKRFTNHPEPWGSFVDIKINAPQVLSLELKKFASLKKKYHICISSVTDPYQPLEAEYKITRKILKLLADYSCFNIEIITKSDLVLRDLDVLKKLKSLSVVFSLGIVEDKIAQFIEPGACLPSHRIKALNNLHQENIKTSVFISPILPGLTDFKAIFEEIRFGADEVFAETFNPKGKNYTSLKKVLQARFPKLVPLYQKIFFTAEHQNYIAQTKKEFYSLAKKYNLPVWGFFTH
jgi:DNA repair photolyase